MIPLSRLSRQSSTPREASLPPCPVVWAGLDVAKATFEAALDCPGPRVAPRDPLGDLPGQGFDRTPQGASRFLAWALLHLPAGTRLAVLMEATGRYSKDLALWLREANDDVAVVIADPWKIYHFAQSLGTRNRTDRVDARIIARFGTDRQPVAAPDPTPDYERLRELTRERRRVVDERQSLESRVSEDTPVALIRSQWKRELALLCRHEQTLDAEIERLTRESEALGHDHETMRQLVGVGPVVASTIQAEAGDPRRFRTSRAFVAFCGLSPQRKESGTSVRGRGKLCKRGSPAIRRALYLAAMAAVRPKKKPNRFQRYYHRRVGEGMKPIAALLAVARKMLVTIHCLITRDADYHDDHQPAWKHVRTPTHGGPPPAPLRKQKPLNTA